MRETSSKPSVLISAKATSRAIRALLEIKSTANEIKTLITKFQLTDDPLSREDQKDELVGKVGKINLWAERYERALTAGVGDVRLTFAQKLEEAKDSVVLNVLELLELKERGISGTDLDPKTKEVADAQVHLKKVIGGAIDG